jgi:NAD-dependent histone deacetylase SIR2
MMLRKRPKGWLRPDIILYGEIQYNGDDLAEIICQDCRRKPDMLLVMGTSLKVDALRAVVKRFSQAVHAEGGISVLVNRTDVISEGKWKDVFDFFIKCDADSWISIVINHWMEFEPRDWDFKNN